MKNASTAQSAVKPNKDWWRFAPPVFVGFYSTLRCRSVFHFANENLKTLLRPIFCFQMSAYSFEKRQFFADASFHDLCKMPRIFHELLARCRAAQSWCNQRDALHGQELTDSLPLLVLSLIGQST